MALAARSRRTEMELTHVDRRADSGLVGADRRRSPGLLGLLSVDLRKKALWLYESDRISARLKVLCADGTAAMFLYRLMQWSRRWRLVPLEMVFNKLNAVCCNCIIGRGAEFGAG